MTYIFHFNIFNPMTCSRHKKRKPLFTTSKSFLKIHITKICKLLHSIVTMSEPDIRQWHPVKGIVFTGSIDCHISKHKKIPIFRKLSEFIVSDHISRQAGWPSKANCGSSLFYIICPKFSVASSAAPRSGGR